MIDNHQTIGELDFILENQNTAQIIHLELAYKFYLYDPNLSSETIDNWIGPNRNDFLKEKLAKTKNKQFPLLFHEAAQSILEGVANKNISQQLCLMAYLFIPYQSAPSSLPYDYHHAIKGYYLNYEDFIGMHHNEMAYYLPLKKEWGIDPSNNEEWTSFDQVHHSIRTNITEKQAVLCWQKNNESYSAFFIVWW